MPYLKVSSQCLKKLFDLRSEWFTSSVSPSTVTYTTPFPKKSCAIPRYIQMLGWILFTISLVWKLAYQTSNIMISVGNWHYPYWDIFGPFFCWSFQLNTIGAEKRDWNLWISGNKNNPLPTMPMSSLIIVYFVNSLKFLPKCNVWTVNNIAMHYL